MATKKKYTKTELARMGLSRLRKLLPGHELAHGSHSFSNEGVCLMEAVAYLAGEEHSDQPECACPVLTGLGISINDTVDDVSRQELLQAVPALIGSKSGSKRVYFKRARAAGNAIVAAAQAEFGSTAKGWLGELAAAKLATIAERGIRSSKDLAALVDAVNHLAHASGDGGEWDGLDFLEELGRVWNTDGITYAQYESLFDNDLVGIIPEESLAEMFVDVATQRAD